MSFKENVGAGGIAGLTSVVCTHPLDLLQVRLQSSQRNLKNVQIIRNSYFMTKGIQGIRSIVMYEGWKGLFRGLLPSLASYVPSRAIFFGFYGFSRRQIVKRGIFSETNPLAALVPASIGIMATSMILNPVFLLKTRIQVQENLIKGENSKYRGTQYKGYMDCVKQIYQKEGFFAFYRGITASWLGISETALYFMIYEKMKSKLGLNKRMRSKTERFPAHLIVGCTIVCKMIAHAAAYPHEVIRTRMRETVSSKNPRLIELTKQIYREEGLAGFYGGMGIHLVRVIPNAIIVFLVYEFVKNRFFSTTE